MGFGKQMMKFYILHEDFEQEPIRHNKFIYINSSGNMRNILQPLKLHCHGISHHMTSSKVSKITWHTTPSTSAVIDINKECTTFIEQERSLQYYKAMIITYPV